MLDAPRAVPGPDRAPEGQAAGGGAVRRRVKGRAPRDLLLAARRPAALRRAAVAQSSTSSNGRAPAPTLQSSPPRGARQGRRRHRPGRRDGASTRKVFNELAVSMVRAGQEGGFLEDVLKRIADFTEHQEDLKAKVDRVAGLPGVPRRRRVHRPERPGHLLRPASSSRSSRSSKEKGELPVADHVPDRRQPLHAWRLVVDASLIGRSADLRRSVQWTRTRGRPARRSTACSCSVPGGRQDLPAAWPCRASRRILGTHAAQRHPDPAGAAASPRTRPATGCWPQAIDEVGRERHRRQQARRPARARASTSRATWSR